MQPDGTVLENRSDVDGLLVFVVTSEVTITEDDTQLPIYAPNVEIHPKISTNRELDGRGDGTGLTSANFAHQRTYLSSGKKLVL